MCNFATTKKHIMKVIRDQWCTEYVCSVCGSPVDREDTVCDFCGHLLSHPHAGRDLGRKTSREYVDKHEPDETICIVQAVHDGGDYLFCKMAVDNRSMMPNGEGRYALGVLMMETDVELYAFSRIFSPSIYEGEQMNLQLDYYDSFRVQGFTIRFDRRYFSANDVEYIKHRYKFN